MSLGSKSLLVLALAAAVAAIVYGGATDEGSATAVLAFVAIGALGLAALMIAAGPDREPPPLAEGQRTPAPGGSPMLPSAWPIVAAAALGLLAIGAASNAAVVVPAVIVCVGAVVGWLSRAWSEDPRYSSRFGSRLANRLLAPVGIPLAVIALVVTIAVSLSRVLLAVSETGSRIVAISFAVVILGSAFLIAYQERLAKAALTALTVFAVVAVVAAGVAGAAHGERKIDKKAGVAATTSTTTTASSVKASPTTTIAARITGAY